MRCVTFHNVVGITLDEFDRALWRDHKNPFKRNMEWLKSHYDIVPLPVALAELAAGRSGERLLCITFDDGYAGVYTHALPVLRDLGLVASVFILTRQGAPIPPRTLLHFERLELAFRLTSQSALDCSLSPGLLKLGPYDSLDESNETLALTTQRERVTALKRIKRWLKHASEPDRKAHTERLFEVLGVTQVQLENAARGSARYEKLSLTQIQTLRAEGWTIGGHSQTHRTLSCLTAEELAEELNGNAADLKLSLGLHAPVFAYPYGGELHAGQREADAARNAGFSCALTMEPGENDPQTDLFKLKRMTMADLQQAVLGFDVMKGRKLWSAK